LRLGVIESVVHSWLAQYVKRLNDDYPELEIDLTVDMSNVLEKRLLAKELDLVIRVEGINSSEIVSDALAIYPVRWIARKGLFPVLKNGLLKNGAAKNGLLERLLQLPILTFGRGTSPQRALEDIVANLGNQVGIPISQTRITCSPSVAAIVQLVKDGYGVAAIPSLFVESYVESGEFVELPIEPIPPSIIVSMCRHANADMFVHAAANAARLACAAYCAKVDRRFIDAVS
jgi:DNA-binding transcriptional LysR family regulator